MRGATPRGARRAGCLCRALVTRRALLASAARGIAGGAALTLSGGTTRTVGAGLSTLTGATLATLAAATAATRAAALTATTRAAAVRGALRLARGALALRVGALAAAAAVRTLAAAGLLGLGRGCDIGRHLTDERGDLGRGRRDLHRGDGDGGLAQQVLDVFLLARHDDRDDRALRAGTGGAARAVQVRLVLHGRVDVDDQLDVVDVHAARGDVGRDEHLRGARRESGEVPVTRGLRQVAVQVHRRNALRRQRLRELLGVVLRAHEEDATPRARREGADELLLGIRPFGVEHVVGHRSDRRVRLVDRVQHLVLQEAVHELVDPVVEGRAEQQALTALRGLVENAGDDREEPQVGHVIGLVDDGDLDRVELDEALLHEVFEAARAGDDDVDAVFERRDLAVLADAAEDRRGLEAVGGCQGLERRVDLRREFTGRGEHEAQDAAGAARAAREGAAEARGHRDREGEGLARAGLAAAEHVAPGEGVGQGVDLDGEGVGLAIFRKNVEQGGGHAERAESDVRHGDVSGHDARIGGLCAVCAQGRRMGNVSRSSGARPGGEGSALRRKRAGIGATRTFSLAVPARQAPRQWPKRSVAARRARAMPGSPAA